MNLGALKFRTESLFKLFRMLKGDNPDVSDKKIWAACKGTKRVRFSSYKPHYGNNAAARNLKHAKAGTHGLLFNYNTNAIEFA